MIFVKNKTYTVRDSITGAETVRSRRVPNIPVIAAAVLVIVLLFMSVKIVPTGFTGVKTTFGQISERTLQNGINFKIPLIQKITLVNNKQQDLTFSDRVWSESKEQTVVYMEQITVTYQIAKDKSAWIYSNVSNFPKDLLSADLVSSALKASTVQIETSKVTNRSIIEPIAKQQMQAALDEKYGENTVQVVKVVINNMDFEDNYNEAIAERQIAQQQYEISAINNKTAVEKAEAEAEATRITAQAEADAELIKAEAKAKANDIISQSITDSTLKLDYIEKWDGVMPKVSGGSGIMYDVSGLTE